MSRVAWPDYFMNIAHLVAERSTCLRRRVGAVAVKDKRILATGYNGAPSKVAHCLDIGCLREQLGVPSGQRHEICRGLHAEQNVIIQAAVHGISLAGAEVYCTHQPCPHLLENAHQLRHHQNLVRIGLPGRTGHADAERSGHHARTPPPAPHAGWLRAYGPLGRRRMSHPYESFMREAAELAERGRWSAAPNPTVGAVLVRDGVVVARGWHTAYGKSHAEVECLKDAEAKGVDPSACTLVVTLEPCNHQGQTPPCTEAVIAAGIRHVVIGLRDPNPKAAGGMERLAEAGVEVEAGVCEELCRDLVADFLIWQTTKRPYVMLKLAMTLDGRIATRTGHSRWITGETARRQVHELRANVGRAGGAILVGGNTLHTDNPLLTARLDDPVERQPLAVSISSRVPAPDSLLLFKERPTETIFFTTASGAATPRAAQLRERGVRIRGLDRWKSGEDLVQILEYLRQEAGCPYVLCEGGGRLGLSLLEAGLVDEFHLHIAPKVLGDNDARPLFDGRTPLELDEALSLRLVRMEPCGEDGHLIFRPVRACSQA